MDIKTKIEKMLTDYSGNKNLSKVEKWKADPMNDNGFLVRTALGDFFVEINRSIYDGITECEGDKYFGPFGE